jgi:hypothetical protein
MVESNFQSMAERIAWIQPERGIAATLRLLGTVIQVSVNKFLTSSGRSVDWTPSDCTNDSRQQSEDEPKR